MKTFLQDNAYTLAIAAAAALAFCLCLPAEAKCRANDQWRGPDKVEHATLGFIVGGAGALNSGSYWNGLAWGAGVGALKELVDSTGHGDCTLQDFLVTTAGAAIGAGAGKGLHLAINPRSKSVQVTYSVVLP